MKIYYLKTIVLILLLTILNTGCVSNASKVLKPFRIAELASESKNYKRAEAYYTKSINANTDNLNIENVYAKRSFVRTELGEYRGAIDDINSILKSMEARSESNDTYKVAFYNTKIATIYRKQGNNTLAIRYHDKAIKTHPKCPYCRLERALTWMKMGNIKIALKECDEIIKNHDDYTLSYLTRAKIRNNSGDKPGALNDLDLALKTTYASKFSSEIKKLKAELNNK